MTSPALMSEYLKRSELEAPDTEQEERGNERDVKSSHLRQVPPPDQTSSPVCCECKENAIWRSEASSSPQEEWKCWMQTGQEIPSALPQGDMLLQSI